MPHLPTQQPIGTPFIELLSVDSTNNYARQQIYGSDLPLRQGFAQHGMAIFTHEQVAGKGQRGKTWASQKGMNLALSVIIKPTSISVAEQFQLSACVAVAAHDFFSRYAGNEDTKIKWPNDLYWQDRKAGGILIESGVRCQVSGADSIVPGVNNMEWAIAGIGININQTTFDGLPNPVSLKQITGKEFLPLELAKELCACLDNRYTSLIADGFENIYSTYLEHLYKKNAVVKLRKDTRVFEALIKTVLPTGGLVVQHAIEEEFTFGEVEWVI